MNLAGKQAKQLFKSLRTGRSPSMVGFWAAATAVDQMRKRKRPKRELIISKKLKPGQSYVIRMPGRDEGDLASALTPGTPVDEIDASGDDSIAATLMSAASDLIGAATGSEAGPEATRAGRDADAETATPVSKGRRARRRAGRLAALAEADIDRSALPRRRRRKLNRAERRARKRPSRRRIRRAGRQQRRAIAAGAPSEPSRRRRRRIRAAEKEVARRQGKVEKRSSRRRRRKLRRAEKGLEKLRR